MPALVAAGRRLSRAGGDPGGGKGNEDGERSGGRESESGAVSSAHDVLLGTVRSSVKIGSHVGVYVGRRLRLGSRRCRYWECERPETHTARSGSAPARKRAGDRKAR